MKKKLLLMILSTAVLIVGLLADCSISNGSTSGGGTTTTSTSYAIGEAGPAGGLIFYVNPNYTTDGWHYLEVAPANTEWTGIKWAESTGSIKTDKGIGFGQQNTTAIVDFLGTSETGRAAQLCANLVINAYSDWFLPSEDELSLMYSNLGANGIGGFDTDAYYWSSSQSSSDTSKANLQNLDANNHNEGEINKNLNAYVRAIRKF